MIADGRLKSIRKKIGGELSTRGPWGVIDRFQCSGDGLDFFLAQLYQSFVNRVPLRRLLNEESHLVVKIFGPPLRHQLLLELSKKNR